MKICKKCGTRYDDAASFCPRDSEALYVDHASLVGRVLDAQYEILSFIAEGGMGAVYAARHTLLGDRVAIKILPPEMRRNNEWLKRFQREGQAARRFRHPNAVVVHDLRTSSEGEVYLVMELVEGRTLDQLARARGGRVEPAESLMIIEQVAGVLDAAHAEGVIHRDLKPSNIMITHQGKVKLLDLGIAKLTALDGAEATALTRSGQFLGTPYYMAPEQWGEMPLDGRDEIDGRVDVYSLGVVVYEITAGVLPFAQQSLLALRQAHCKESPRPLEEMAMGVPPLWSEAVRRAMSKDRSERQATAGEFAAQLRASLGDEAPGSDATFYDARAVAPTIKGDAQDTSLAGRGATPQEMPLITVDHVVMSPTPPTPVRRSWTLGLMSSRGCQVSLTVAAVAVIAVMVGGYAMINNMRSGDQAAMRPNTTARENPPSASPRSDGGSASTANTNANTSAAAKDAFMSYHLLISPTTEAALNGKQRRVTNDEPIPPGQSMQFVLMAKEKGYLYAVGHNEQGEAVVIPLGTPVLEPYPARIELEAGQEVTAPALGHIKLNSKPGEDVYTIIFTDKPLDLPFASESLPLDGSFRKLTADEKRKVEELRQQAVPVNVRFQGGQENKTAIVALNGERGSKPVVFDIKLRLQR
jgi:serine/threonine protein kinase